MSAAEPRRWRRFTASGLAVVTFDSPPLNLFDAPFRRPGRRGRRPGGRRPRAVLFRAEGRVVSGGVDVSLFAALSGPREAEGVFAGWRWRAASIACHARPCSPPTPVPDLGV